MAITRLMRFSRRAWAFPTVPGLPDGYWTIGGDDVGDASGGSMVWQHFFAQPSSGFGDPSSFFSIEQMVMSVTIDLDRLVQIVISGMDQNTQVPTSTSTGVVCIYTVPLTADGISSASIRPDQGVNSKIWVGRFAGVTPGDSGLINLTTPNPTATDSFRVKLQGFFWGPEAMNAPGGLQRPVNGIYGA